MSSRRAPGAEELLEAVVTLVRSIQWRIYDALPGELDIEDLLTECEKAVGASAMKSLRPVAESVAEHFRKTTDRLGNSASVVRGVEVSLGRLLQACFDHILASGESAELKTARAELQQAELALHEALGSLEEAVVQGDVGAVLRLRTECEVLIPKRVDEARIAVLELEVAQAEAQADRPARLQETAQAEALAAEEAGRAAYRAAERAQTEAQRALARRGMTDTVAQRYVDTAEKRRAQLATLKMQATQSSQQRMRKLAGLEAVAG